MICGAVAEFSSCCEGVRVAMLPGADGATPAGRDVCESDMFFSFASTKYKRKKNIYIEREREIIIYRNNMNTKTTTRQQRATTN